MSLRIIVELTGWTIYDSQEGRSVSLDELGAVTAKHMGYGVGVIEDLTRPQPRASEGDAPS